MLGLSGGVLTAISYAARHPDRVTHLVLQGAFTNARSWSTDEEHDAFMVTLRANWDKPNPAIRHMLAATIAPDATREQQDWFSETLLRTM